MPIAKVIEIVVSSPKSFDDALQQGIREAGRTLRGISGVHVVNWTVDVENNAVKSYKLTLHVAFALEGHE